MLSDIKAEGREEVTKIKQGIKILKFSRGSSATPFIMHVYYVVCP